MVQSKQTTKEPKREQNSKKFGVRPIDICLVDIAAETDKATIPNPIEAIQKRLPGMNQDQIKSQLQSLKNAKLIESNSKNGAKFTRVKVTDELCSIVYQTLATHVPQYMHTTIAIKQAVDEAVKEAFSSFKEESMETIKPRKKICIFVDYDNIMLKEREVSKKISYHKLKEYARGFGDVILPMVFVPEGFDKADHLKQYFNWCEFIRVPCELSQKDTDQVDYHIRDMVRRVNHLSSEIEFWIVSRDSDFKRIRELGKDLNQNQIKIINPFEISQVLGYTEQEQEVALSVQVHKIVSVAKVLTPEQPRNEIQRDTHIRVSIHWLKQQNDVLEFNKPAHFHETLRKALVKELGNTLHIQPRNMVIAFSELGLISQINNKIGFRYKVNKDHELFERAIPYEWRERTTTA